MTTEEALLITLFLAGLALGVAGVAMLSHAAAFIVAGIALAGLAFFLGIAPRRRPFDQDEE